VPLLVRTTPVSGTRRLAARAQEATTAERLALSRAGVGAVMLTRPRLVPGLLGVDSATSARMGWAMQMLGAREMALGLGTWSALRSGDARAARLWLAAGVLSDAVDALTVGAAVVRGRLSAGAGSALVAVAGAATALGVQAVRAQAVARPYDDVDTA
jgi:hypothetical protein